MKTEDHGEYRKVVTGFNNTLNAISSPFSETITVGDMTARMTSSCRGDYNIRKY